jgi:hypothetical protein
MLQSISWLEFFTKTGLIVGGYYVITGLLLFSKEIGSFLKSKSSRSPLNQFSQTPLQQTDQLIGVAKPESSGDTGLREVVVSADEVLVSESSVAEEPIEVTSVTVTVEDDVASLTSEIDALVSIVSDSSRDESLPLFQSLISRYASLVDTDHVEPLSQLLHDKVSEHCNFKIDVDEIRGWWSMADERIRHKSK